MAKNGSSLTFNQLLEICSDPNHTMWELAWQEFIKRYKMFISNSVRKRCIVWNVTRLRRQFSETVNDLVSEVFIILCKNDCKAMKDFQSRDNEQFFKIWLATICARTTGRYIQRVFVTSLVDSEIEEFQDYLTGLGFDHRWELYESLIAKLREGAGVKQRNIERNIHIFLLYTWGDFSAPMISSYVCLANIGHRVVDNVVNRLRSVLVENAERD